MTVQLKQLLVTADMNAAGYARGAQQKKAADEAMIQSGRQAVFVFQEADNKLSQSGDVLARLSRQYVDGFANAQKFATAVNSLTRGVERGRVEISQASTILDGIYRKYGMMADASKIAERGQIELARAVERANQRFQEQRRIVPANDVGMAGGVGGRNFAATNAMFQFQDIAMTAAMGMNPAMIGLQQGSQLAGAYAGMSGREALSTSLAGLAGMVNPVSLIAIGLTTAAAAAIQFGQGLFGAGKEAENLDKVMKRHQETVKALGDQWGGVLEKQSQYGQRSSAVVGFGAEMSAAQIRDALRRQVPDVLQSITGAAGANLDAIGGGRAFRSDPMFGLLSEDVDRLVRAAQDGSPDIVGLTRRISEMARASDNPGIRKLADDIILAITPVEELSRKLLQVERAFTQLSSSVGPNGMALSQGRIAQNDNTAAALFESQNRIAADRSRQAFQAQLSGITARSPAERAEAARLSEASRYDLSETAPARRQRIEQAGLLALAQSEQQLLDARRDRARALDASMAQQQVELSLIGKTISEQERLRMEHRLIAELRAEAARNNTSVDEEEISRIRAKSSEYGRLAEQMAAQRALLGQDREIAALDQRLSLVGQSEAAQVRTNALMQAEMRLREMGIDLGSREAEQYRRKAEYIALQTDELRKQEAALGRVRDTAENSIDTLLDRFMEGDPLGGLADVAKEWSKTILQLGVANPLKNGLLGTNHETLNDIGGLNGLFSKVFGGGMATASMSVTATAVSVNGGMPGIGNPFGPANDNFGADTTLSDLLGYRPANQNVAGAGSALGFVGNYRSGVDARLTDILDTAARQFGGYKVDAMSGFRPGDPRFHGRGLATDIQLTDLSSGKLLGNYQDAGSFAGYERFAQTARAVQMAKYPELADKFRWGGYFGGGKGKYGALDTMHFDLAGAGMGGGSWEGGLTSAQRSLWPGIESKGMAAASALDRLAGKTTTAVDSLGVFQNGMQKVGDVFSNFSLGGGAGGGGFNWGSLFSGFRPNTTLSDFLFNGFADGTEWTPGGLAMVGERGREIVRLPRGSQVVSNHRTESLAAAGRNEGSQGGGFSQVINNYSGEAVKTEERPDGRGGRRQIVTIGSIVAEAMGTPGSPLARQMEQQFGVKRRMNNKWQ